MTLIKDFLHSFTKVIICKYVFEVIYTLKLNYSMKKIKIGKDHVVLSIFNIQQEKKDSTIINTKPLLLKIIVDRKY